MVRFANTWEKDKDELEKRPTVSVTVAGELLSWVESLFEMLRLANQPTVSDKLLKLNCSVVIQNRNEDKGIVSILS